MDACTRAAEPVLSTNASVSQPVLPVIEQLMYSSVRLFHKTQSVVNGKTVDTLNWGSGFRFNFFNTKDFWVPAIVTNRHVAESMGDECTFNFG